MDIIKHSLEVIFKLAFGILLFVFVWWVITLLFPALTITALRESLAGNTSTSTVKSKNNDILPDPRTYKGLFSSIKTPGENSNVYEPGPAYAGYGKAYSAYSSSQASFVTYTASGTTVTNGDGSVISYKEYSDRNPGTLGTKSVAASSGSPAGGYSKKELYIRNLSIYEGGHIYTGISFVGEARSTMFINGKFPIIIADMAGRVVAVTYAEATTNWATPGWVRFQTRINSVLPNKVRCLAVFEQARSNSQYPYNDVGEPVRVAVPVLCN